MAATSTMTIRMGANEKALINDYAKTFGMTASEFVRTAVLERIEDELDLRDWYAAKPSSTPIRLPIQLTKLRGSTFDVATSFPQKG